MIEQMRRAMVRCVLCVPAVVAMLASAGAAHGADARDAVDAARMPDSTLPGEHNHRFFRDLRAMNLSLAKSYESFQAEGYDDKTGKPQFDPATFSLSRSAGDDVETSYATQYFLGWMPLGEKGGPLLGTDWTLMLSAEGNISSDDEQSVDAVRFRSTGEGVYSFGADAGMVVNASLKFEADSDFDTEKLIGEFEFHPVYLPLGIGQRLALTGQPPLENGKLVRRADVQLRWEPWLRLDVGETLDAPADAAEQEDTVLRVVGVAEGKLFFNNVANALNMYEVSLSVGEKFHYLPLEDGRQNYNFFSAGVHFLPSPNVSVDLTYDIGRDAPTFEKQEMLRLAIGLRF